MPLIRYIQKITRDQNFLVWRDTVYINADGRSQYLSLKLVSDIDALLQGKISEYIFQSEFKEVKFSCDEVRILGRNLVAEYLFYEGSGTVLHDTSGNGNNATIYGATWNRLTNGKWCLSFDGVDDKAVTPINPAGWNKLTLEIVFKLTSYDETQAQRPAGAYNIFDIAIPKNNENMWVGIYANEDGKLYNVSLGVTPTDILNKWIHVVMTFGGTFINGYINAVIKGTTNIPFNAHLHEPSVIHYIQIGAVDSILPFSGNIATTRIFNKALQDDDIQMLFKLAQIAVQELA